MEAAQGSPNEPTGGAPSGSGSNSEVIGRRIGAILIDGIAVFLPLRRTSVSGAWREAPAWSKPELPPEWEPLQLARYPLDAIQSC